MRTHSKHTRARTRTHTSLCCHCAQPEDASLGLEVAQLHCFVAGCTEQWYDAVVQSAIASVTDEARRPSRACRSADSPL